MKALSEQNFYELLEVDSAASTSEILAAHQRLAEQYRPDSMVVYGLAEPEELESLQRRLDEAKAVLSNEESRDEYDRSLGLPARASVHAGAPLDGVEQLPMGELLHLADQAPASFPGRPGQASPAREAPEDAGSPSPGAAAGPTLALVPAPPSTPPIEPRENPRGRPPDTGPQAEFNGELLRQVREYRGVSIAQLAARTRISVHHLENVEADRYPALPATVYLRGILMNLARELGLDALVVSRSYLALVARHRSE